MDFVHTVYNQSIKKVSNEELGLVLAITKAIIETSQITWPQD